MSKGPSLRLPPRELALSLGLFLLLLVLLVLRGEKREIPYDPHSGGPGGLLALRFWLSELGYEVWVAGDDGQRLLGETDLLFLYPGRGDEPAGADEIRDWVKQGHTLVVVGADEYVVSSSRRMFDVGLPGSSSQCQPVFPAAPAVFAGQPGGDRFFVTVSDGALPVLAAEDGLTTAAVQREGRGTVWYLSERHSLNNADLKDGHGAHIVLAVLRTVPAGGRVTIAVQSADRIDAERSEAYEGLRDWLYRAPPGRALLFAGVVVFLGLLLGGLRLGPALPTPEHLRRREASEHVMAMAALARQAGHRQAVARHHRARLKAHLGRRVHLAADLPDDEFMQRWQEMDDGIDPQMKVKAQQLFAGLSADPDDPALVRLVSDIDAVLAAIGS